MFSKSLMNIGVYNRNTKEILGSVFIYLTELLIIDRFVLFSLILGFLKTETMSVPLTFKFYVFTIWLTTLLSTLYSKSFKIVSLTDSSHSGIENMLSIIRHVA